MSDKKFNSESVANHNKIIKIENENLASIFMIKLGKQKNEFYEEDFLKIETLVIDEDSDIKNNEFVDFQILQYLKNLKELVLANMDVLDFVLEDLAKLNKLKKIIFHNCNIISEDILKNLKIQELQLIHTDLSQFLILYDLPNLKNVVLSDNIYDANINYIQKLKEKNINIEKYNVYSI